MQGFKIQDRHLWQFVPSAACEHVHHDGQGVPEGSGAPPAATPSGTALLALRASGVAAHRGGSGNPAPHLLVVHLQLVEEALTPASGGLEPAAVAAALHTMFQPFHPW